MATSSVSRYAGTSYNSNRALELSKAAAQTAADNRGRNIVILDMREVTPEFDYFVLATGTSRRQLHAMSEEIDHRLEDGMGEHRLGVEGYARQSLDSAGLRRRGDSSFRRRSPRLLRVEQLWCTAKRVPLDLIHPSRRATPR